MKGSESVQGKDVKQRCLFKRKTGVGDRVMSSVFKYQVVQVPVEKFTGTYSTCGRQPTGQEILSYSNIRR